MRGVPLSQVWVGGTLVPGPGGEGGNCPVSSPVPGLVEGGLSSPMSGGPPPVNKQTENITFPHTPCVGGNKAPSYHTNGIYTQA